MRTTNFCGLVARPYAAVIACSMLAVSGCVSDTVRKANQVAVTGVHTKLNNCQRIGPVYDSSDSGDTYFDRMMRLRKDTVLAGGNTLFLTSPFTSVDGTAYHCDPPIKPDSAG